jgi:hypothetical protein
VALGLTQPVTEMRRKGGRYAGPTTLSPSCADLFEIWAPQRTGIFRPCPGL